MKKKILCISIITILVFSLTVLAEELNYCPFDIFLNNVNISNSKVIMVDDSVYVPLRWFGNLMGYGIQWDQNNQSIEIQEYQYPEYTAVEIDGKYGYKNENGDIVIEPQFNYAMDFTEGLGMVRFEDKTFGFINMNGIAVIKDIYPNTQFKDGVAIAIKYDNNLNMNNTEGNRFYTDQEYQMYYIDKCGNILFGRYFVTAEQFQDGFACVQTEGYIVPGPNIKNVYTYIDRSGNYATELRFDWADSFENGKAKVIKDGVKGTIDTNFVFTPNDK